ncbi:helix-turn-helix transcriptional regulator [Ottowia thiooxydans]|uniref:helix-turn-helix transcriptional regulator n=1 Tax=Ottowia thiooxydans TaxID=219182 RepID=UPI0004237117|nr:helix-turn-helix transcriptional regulator [Ottowia thiooxydans]
MSSVISQRFCTDVLPAVTRMEQIRESYARLDMAVDLEPLEDERAFRLDLTSTRLNSSTSLGGGFFSPYISGRSRAMAARAGMDAVWITRFSQPYQYTCGPLVQTEFAPGDTLLAPMDEPFECLYPTTGIVQTVWMQRAAVGGLLDRPASRLGNNPQLDLLFGYAASIQRQEVLDEPLAHLAATHLADLLTLALGARGDDADQAHQRGERAARLAALRAQVARSYRDPQLSVVDLAKHHHMSVRQVQRMFEEDGSTFTLYLQQCRLEHVRRALADPTRARQLIATIAYEAGFSDLAAFNRLFKQRFGVPPTQIRELAVNAQTRL